MRTSSGLTDDALIRTNTSLGPTITGERALLVNTRSSMVPYEWACHAIILGDHVMVLVVTLSVVMSSTLHVVMNVRRIVERMN